MKALEYDSNYIDPLHLISTVEAQMGNFDAAKIIADKLMVMFPEEEEGYRLNAGIYFMNYDFDKSFKLYQKAYKKDPNDPWNNKQLGRLHCYIKDDYKKGIPFLIKGSGFPSLPGHEPSFAWLADAYKSIGDYEKAMLYANRDITYKSSCRNLYGVFSNYIVQGKYEQCLNFLDSMCTISACDNCDPFYFIIHTINGNFEKAVQFTNVDSSMWVIRYHIAFFNIKTGNIEERKILLNVIISDFEAGDIKRGFIGPRRPYIIDSHFHLAESYSLLGEKKKAIDHLRKCEERGFWYGHHDLMMSSPEFDGLKSDPDFLAIYNRVQKKKAAVRIQVREMGE